MTAAELDARRVELTKQAMDLIAKRGAMIGKSDLAAETRVSRARVDEVFPEESDLFESIVEQWYAHDIEIMEAVVASDLPVQRKFYEFYARRFRRERERYNEDPGLFALYVELGSERIEQVRGYIDLADHYLTELIAQAQAEGFFAGLTINRALSLINQMVLCYTSPQVMLMLEGRLTEDKLAAIVDTLFAGLSAADRGAAPVIGLRIAE